MAQSERSICSGLTVVLEYLYLGICYNLGSWDPAEMFTTRGCQATFPVHWLSDASHEEFSALHGAAA